MIKSIYVAFLILIVCQSNNFKAQDEPIHKLGVQSGLTTGIGLSYKFQVDGFALQAVVFPYVFKDESNILRPSIFGLSVQGVFLQRKRIDLFAWASISHYGFPGLIPFINAGLGPGIEFHIGKRVNINLQYGIAYVSMNVDPFFFLAGEVGLHFRINKQKTE